MKRFAIMIIFCLTVSIVAGEIPPQDNAWQLEQQGKTSEAFLAYLAIPGCENAAARLARGKPAEYQKLLEEHAREFSAPRVSLIKGDLLLAQGTKTEALAAYRNVIARISTQPGQGWDMGVLPPDYYPSEYSTKDGHFNFPAYFPLEPFSCGPGSHRDNWLIRRFIALEAWNDAAREFARIWELHRQRSRPHSVMVSVWNPETKTSSMVKKTVGHTGFDSLGLQFAIDYAFFLKQQKQLDSALSVLREPLLQIDMEQNPNIVRYVPQLDNQMLPELSDFPHAGRGGTLGLSRKEYIRLAYGEFKSEKRENELSAALQGLIDNGWNCARRVLAQIRRHEGKLDETLRLENEFITAGNFDEWTSLYRHALLLEELQKNAMAAEAYAKLLMVAYQPPKLPDQDEEARQAEMRCQAIRMRPDPKSEAARLEYQSEIIERLKRLYGSLGQPEKAMNLALQQFDLNPRLLEQMNLLEQMTQSFREEPRFEGWARQHIAKSETPIAKANLLWLAKDYNAAGKTIAVIKSGGRGLEEWKIRFRGVGKDPNRNFLQALLENNPQDARTRMELLDLDVKTEGPDPTHLLELLLDSKTQPAFERGKGVRNNTQFRNYYDLAYRLMRRYEKEGQIVKLVDLGLRIATRKKPFNDELELGLNQYEYRDGNAMPEDVNACLALAIQYLDPATEGPRFLAALKESLWLGARRQLERRLTGVWRPEKLKPHGWANAPTGVALLASNENVLSLTRDDRYVYAGMPWGVAVYDFNGEPVTRIALGDAAKALAVIGAHLWAGTPKGLFRIDPKDWRVQHQWLDLDLPEKERSRLSNDPNASWFNNGVYTLVVDGDLLWIGLHRNVQVLNTRTLELMSFSFLDLKIDHWAGYERIYPEKDYVWADSPHSGLRRYDRKTQLWDVVAYDNKSVRLIGDVDGTLYGTATLPEPLRARPCVIKRDSLEVSPLLIESLSRDQQCINGPFGFFGRINGKPVFGAGYEQFRLEDGKLWPLSDAMRAALESVIPEGLRNALTFQSADGTVIACDNSTHRHQVFGMPFISGNWTLLPLPDGVRVLGGQTSRSPRYEYPQEDHGSGPYETWNEEGGLYFVDAQKRPQRVSSANGGDGLLGDVVYGMFFDETRNLVWLCTNVGIASLNLDGQVVGHFSRAEGLCCNRIQGGVAADGKLYFAGGWGDQGGGLGIFDLHTSVFTSLSSVDGLDSDFLQSLSLENGKIKITFGVEYERNGTFNYHQFPPAIYDPLAGNFTSGGAAKIFKRGESQSFPGKQDLLPFLGGHILARVERAGKEYLCGTRGLVIRDINNSTSQTFIALGAKLLVSDLEKQFAAAKEYKGRIRTCQDLETAFRDPNPFSRANALAEAAFNLTQQKECVPLIASQLNDSCLRVRCSALYTLMKIKEDEQVVPLLQGRLADKDRQIRVAAAIELARRGKRPDLKCFVELARNPNAFGNFPFGAKSSIDARTSQSEMYYALAADVTPELFNFLLEYPPHFGNDDNEKKLLPKLGEGLRRHPDAATLLLKAYDGQKSRFPYKREFAQWVFKSAGNPLLPLLHEALRSKDRVVRSNAARGCGAIGDVSSIPLLIQALELESGLSRASIVWALGELKAAEALPQMANLLVDARNDRRRGGIMTAQSSSATQSTYNELRNIDTVAADWNELKAAAQSAPVDPEHSEELLNEEIVLNAVAKIGAVSAGGFYRSLAGDKNLEGRREAAIHLAAGNPRELEQNLAVLHSLAADPEFRVRIPATVSLLIIGQDMAEKPILAWLASTQRWERELTVRELVRVKEHKKLDFARMALKSLADDPSVDNFTQQEALKLLQ